MRLPAVPIRVRCQTTVALEEEADCGTSLSADRTAQGAGLSQPTDLVLITVWM